MVPRPTVSIMGRVVDHKPVSAVPAPLPPAILPSQKKRVKTKKRKFPKTMVCRVDGCRYTTEDTSNLRQHRQNIHNIGVIWCYCTQPGCNKRFKQKHVLQNHLFSIHNIGKSTRRGTVFCTTCDRRFQSKYALKEHILINHTPDDEVDWFHCTVVGCNLKFRKNAYLLRHYRRKHKIPVHGTPGRPSKYKAEGRGGEWRSFCI